MGRTSSTSSSSTATDPAWTEYARGVTPLRGRAAPPRSKPAVALRAAARAEPMPAPGTVATPDRRTLENLRRGRMRPEARLDLHGMTRAEAFAELSAFVVRAQSRGIRVALVITGRSGVLREEVPRWLTTTGLRPRILGIAEAKPRDGGVGALYVLIRRPKP